MNGHCRCVQSASHVGGPVSAKLDWRSSGCASGRIIFHAGIGEDTSFFTVTVWESRAAYDAFAPVFSQVMKERGFEFGKPEILPVHHFLPPRVT